ncbi:hypothetical protein IDH44_03555 [Paenibacillus sp. IB182496]|uniref:Uncharacterized protein n=1 Tax=Paenibacillus sabuli TaxID=2772509 RepID=A0A927BRK9_9BACL|nr:hypothetical protein [Paenibacillus sabuli]MBD2844254.1 hypothetical protein [Paenibacillus sabuli]
MLDFKAKPASPFFMAILASFREIERLFLRVERGPSPAHNVTFYLYCSSAAPTAYARAILYARNPAYSRRWSGFRRPTSYFTLIPAAGANSTVQPRILRLFPPLEQDSAVQPHSPKSYKCYLLKK